MTRLRRAADLGSPSAEGQLAAFAQVGDVEAWLTRPERRQLLRDPRFSAAADFLPPAFCEWMIGRARPRLDRALVFDLQTGDSRQEDARNNSSFDFGFADLDLVATAVRERMALTLNVPPGALEPMQVLHYAPGQTFARHHDFLDVSVPGHATDVARSGQRIITFLVYLNADYDGGETDFPLIGLKFKGQPGEALMFANIRPDGQPDRRTLHAGLPPTSGEKWLLSQWVRDRAVV
jgi:prolyl 4-hydroxylase